MCQVQVTRYNNLGKHSDQLFKGFYTLGAHFDHLAWCYTHKLGGGNPFPPIITLCHYRFFFFFFFLMESWPFAGPSHVTYPTLKFKTSGKISRTAKFEVQHWNIKFDSRLNIGNGRRICMGSSCWMGKPCHEHKCTTMTLPQNTNILQIYAKLNSIKTFTMSCYRPPTCFQNILFLIQLFSSQSSTIYNCFKATSGHVGSMLAGLCCARGVWVQISSRRHFRNVFS